MLFYEPGYVKIQKKKFKLKISFYRLKFLVRLGKFFCN